MDFQYAERLSKLPPYLFARIDVMKAEARAKGIDLIDLGIGDPDTPTPHHIVERMKKAVEKKEHHRYPSYEGMLSFREACADWYMKRFGVKLSPEKEVTSLIGSKEGIAHFPVAFVNPGEIVLVPSPGYPVYNIGTLFAGGISYFMPLKKENGFLPDLKAIPDDIAKKAKIIWVNYPNNPTAAVAEKGFYEELLKFAIKHNIIVASDVAYTEMSYDGYKPMSFLEIDGAREVGIEFHSLSKTYNMTGWRIGFAVGNPSLVGGLGKIKTNVDSGAFQAVQEAAIEALEASQESVEQMKLVYQERRDVLVSGLKECGLEVENPKATFYVWITVPKGYNSAEFTAHLLSKAGIVSTPGNGFGEAGEGYVRMALTVDKNRLKEAVDRVKKVGF